jgi:hypothetical protein
MAEADVDNPDETDAMATVRVLFSAEMLVLIKL